MCNPVNIFSTTVLTRIVHNILNLDNIVRTVR